MSQKAGEADKSPMSLCRGNIPMQSVLLSVLHSQALWLQTARVCAVGRSEVRPGSKRVRIQVFAGLVSWGGPIMKSCSCLPASRVHLCLLDGAQPAEPHQLGPLPPPAKPAAVGQVLTLHSSSDLSPFSCCTLKAPVCDPSARSVDYQP